MLCSSQLHAVAESNVTTVVMYCLSLSCFRVLQLAEFVLSLYISSAPLDCTSPLHSSELDMLAAPYTWVVSDGLSLASPRSLAEHALGAVCARASAAGTVHYMYASPPPGALHSVFFGNDSSEYDSSSEEDSSINEEDSSSVQEEKEEILEDTVMNRDAVDALLTATAAVLRCRSVGKDANDHGVLRDALEDVTLDGASARVPGSARPFALHRWSTRAPTQHAVAATWTPPARVALSPALAASVAHLPVCGDGVVAQGEACDRGAGCTARCVCAPGFTPCTPPRTHCCRSRGAAGAGAGAGAVVASSLLHAFVFVAIALAALAAVALLTATVAFLVFPHLPQYPPPPLQQQQQQQQQQGGEQEQEQQEEEEQQHESASTHNNHHHGRHHHRRHHQQQQPRQQQQESEDAFVAPLPVERVGAEAAWDSEDDSSEDRFFAGFDGVLALPPAPSAIGPRDSTAFPALALPPPPPPHRTLSPRPSPRSTGTRLRSLSALPLVSQAPPASAPAAAAAALQRKRGAHGRSSSLAAAALACPAPPQSPPGRSSGACTHTSSSSSSSSGCWGTGFTAPGGPPPAAPIAATVPDIPDIPSLDL